MIPLAYYPAANLPGEVLLVLGGIGLVLAVIIGVIESKRKD